MSNKERVRTCFILSREYHAGKRNKKEQDRLILLRPCIVCVYSYLVTKCSIEFAAFCSFVTL